MSRRRTIPIAHVETSPTWFMAVGPAAGRLGPARLFFACLLVSYRTLASIWLIAKKPRAPGHARRELVQRDLSSLSQGIAQNNKARNR